MNPETPQNPSPRIAVLTSGDSTLSWHLIQQLKERSTGPVFVAATEKSGPSRSKISTNSVRNRFSSAFRAPLGKLFRKYILLHPTPPEAPHVGPESEYTGPLNSSILAEKLSDFQPDVLLISGTNKISNEILNTAPIRLNMHAGFVPYYRGTAALEWTVLQKNYQYLGVTIHSVTEKIDGGEAWRFVPVAPYPLEPFVLYKNRLTLVGQNALIDAALQAGSGRTDNVKQGETGARSYRKSDQPVDFRQQVQANFTSGDPGRFSLTHGGDPYSGNRFVKPFVRKKLRRQVLANGWYIVNYHDICADAEFENATNRVPSIFTERSTFLNHLEYWREHFQPVSIYEGIELLERGEATTKKYLTITFDDGLKNTTSCLEPLNTAGFRPTLFLSGDPLTNNRPLANHAGIIGLRLSARLAFTNQEIIDGVNKMANGEAISPELATSIMGEYITQLDFDSNMLPGEFDVGAHSMTHTRPAGSIDPRQANEVSESISVVSQATKIDIDLYAHPFGKMKDRSIDSDWAAEQQSLHHFACAGGINVSQNQSGALNRIAIQNESMDELNTMMLMQWGA
jgi:peptidoglycan/xylan/chitin deacetylase (PgdA/CDA1 family)